MFTITVNAGIGVTVSPAEHEVPENSEATFVFTTNEQYQIIDVFVDGHSQGPVTKYTFKDVTADHELVIETLDKTASIANFTKKCVDKNDNTKKLTALRG